MKETVTISWSGGKDSAFALYKILLSGDYSVKHLHTVIGKDTRRVGLHGIHEDLIDLQAKVLGIPLVKLYLETSNDRQAYESLMQSFYNQCAADGINGVVFGDIFLEDLKEFRDNLLKNANIKGIYPIWKYDTKLLLQDFLGVGFKTIVCSANAKYFKQDQLGKTIDQQFIGSLVLEVDPCGENGEFHTFVYDGPIFTKPLIFRKGNVVIKEYNYNIRQENGEIQAQKSSFWFQELLPINS